MKKLMLPNIEYLHIRNEHTLLYGGSQQNYSSFRARVSGCGPTTASNMLAYISQTQESVESLFPYTMINYNTVLNMMNTMWDFITPGVMGVNNVSIFSQGMQEYLNQLGLLSPLTPISLEVSSNPKNRINQNQMRDFIVNRVENGFPVAFLNLHAGGLSNLDSWHWVLIVGIEYDENNIYAIIYDEGRKKKIDLGIWLKQTKKSGGFVSLEYKD